MAKMLGIRCDACGREVHGEHDALGSVAWKGDGQAFRTVSIVDSRLCRQETSRDVCGECIGRVRALLGIPDDPPTEKGRAPLAED